MKPGLDNIGHYGKLLCPVAAWQEKYELYFYFLFVKGRRLLIFFHSCIMYFGICSYFIYVFCLFFCRTWRSSNTICQGSETTTLQDDQICVFFLLFVQFELIIYFLYVFCIWSFFVLDLLIWFGLNILKYSLYLFLNVLVVCSFGVKFFYCIGGINKYHIIIFYFCRVSKYIICLF